MANFFPKRFFSLPSVVSCLLLVVSLSGCGDIESQLASITVSPSSATIGVNKTQLFSAIGKDSVGKIVQVSPTWSVQGNIGTISSTGLFTAGSVEGTGNVVATLDSLSASASVTVTAKAWVNGTVKDEIGKLVQGIKVYLKNTSLFDFTESDGKYSIADVSAGTYECWTEDPNGIYKPASLEAITVGSGETKSNVDFIIYYYSKPPDLTPPTLP